MKGRGGLAALAAMATVPLVSCDFATGSTLNPCTQSIPAACGNTANCALTSDEYLAGTFPGQQTFVVRTTAPQKVTFRFVFLDRRAAGTGLALTSTEPDCSDQSSYMSQGDVFELSGPEGILEFPIQMTTMGDHLVQFHSDAYCSYEMRFQ